MTIRPGLRLVAISRGVGRHFLQAQAGEERTTGYRRQHPRTMDAAPLDGRGHHVLIRSSPASCSLSSSRLTDARLLAAFGCTVLHSSLKRLSVVSLAKCLEIRSNDKIEVPNESLLWAKRVERMGTCKAWGNGSSIWNPLRETCEDAFSSSGRHLAPLHAGMLLWMTFEEV